VFALFVLLVAMPVILMVAAQVFAMRAQSAKDNYVVVAETGVDSAQLAAEHTKRFGVVVRSVWEGGYDGLILSRRVHRVRADERVHEVQHRETAESFDRWLGD
jgi:hypothetical protein